MKYLKKILIIILVFLFMLSVIGFIGFKHLQKNDPNKTFDETRKDYNMGSCYNMQEDLCYYIIFIDDDECSWNEEEKDIFINKKFLPTMDFLSRQALLYNTEISTDYKVCEKTVTYMGIMESETRENGGQYDILSQVAKSMGYNSHWEMTIKLKKELNVKQVAYLIAVNKEGRSYKHVPPYGPFERPSEFCVFFSQSIGYTDTSCYSSIGHEILHLFGAEDYYNSSYYPERNKLAKELYPDDIMFATAHDINEKTIGAYTAYSVGWLDKLPEECNTENWWK